MKNPLTELLRPHVPALKRDAAGKGELSDKAKRVIQLYQMHVDCPYDPGAPALCEAAFKEWEAATAELVPKNRWAENRDQ